MFNKIKIRIGFPFCVTALIFLSGELRYGYLCALILSLFHETGHLLAMLFYGMYPDSVVFTPTGIRINCPDRIVSCRAECIISASGPIVNLILMPVVYFIAYPLLFYINTGLFIINMIPLRSLDAGRFLYNLILHFKDEFQAERIMNIIETVVCVFIIAVLIISLVNGIVNPSFILFSVMVVITTVVQLVK